MSLSRVRLAIAQLNLTVGDLKGNCAKILEYAHLAAAQGVRILLTPELSITGYPPEDLLLRPAFMQACVETLDTLAADLAQWHWPLVVASGNADSITTPASCQAVAQAAGVAWNDLGSVGHACPLEAPGAVNALLGLN